METQTAMLAEELLQLADKSAEIQIATLNLSRELTEVSDNVTGLEGTIKGKIANETDEAGKKKYANADARELAFIELTKHDLEINSLKEKSQQLQYEIQLKKIEIERLKERQRNIRAVLAIFAHE